MAANDTVFYMGGTSMGAGGLASGNNTLFVAINANTGANIPWRYTPNGSIRTSMSIWVPVVVSAIALNGNRIYMSGSFLGINNYSSPSLAVFGDVGNNTPLPFRSISLWAQEKSNTALLNWQVDEEDNIAKYEVEKSSDGKNFISFGTILINNNHQYQLTDSAPYSTNFYRIKAVTKSGTVIYSKVVKLDTRGKGEITIYPNPVIANEFQLQLNNVRSGSYQMVIYNLAGQKQAQRNFVHRGGSQTISEDVSKVANGVNIVTLTDKSGKVLYKERWVKM